jgi:hypothetical protein
MPSAALVTFFQVLTPLGAALTGVRLVVSGLHRRYKVLFSFLVFLVLQGAALLFLDNTSQLYLKIWVSSEPILWLFEILVVRELYKLILEKHKGLYTLGRWAMNASVAVSVILSVLSLLPRITPATPQSSRIIGVILAMERGVDMSLALFILLMLLFLSLCPVPLSRNIVIHAAVYSLFFLSNTLGILLRVIVGLRVNNQVNLFLMGISSVCTLAWLLLLSAKGEEVRVNLPWISADHEERILHQLDALNATLLRASRN